MLPCLAWPKHAKARTKYLKIEREKNKKFDEGQGENARTQINVNFSALFSSNQIKFFIFLSLTIKPNNPINRTRKTN